MALQDIDLSYDRSGALTTPRALKVGGPLTVAGNSISAPSNPQPADHGFIAWAYDSSFTSTGQLLTNGTIHLSAVYLRAATTISKCWWLVSAAAVTPTAGQNWVGLVKADGTVLSTAGIDALITTASVARSATLTTPQAVAPGMYWVAIVCNAATAPTLMRTNGLATGTNNANLAGATLRYATNLTGQTSLPASIAPASNSPGPSLWVAVS
ncbi:hypothetical protein AB0M68_03635 [Streptomyces sp. NPDC051453]|uniref:hypothetical protein n=1 Tax=Streptomyces sp. NPDC051453 TaxID=3154941 RepID=UPI003418F75A